MSLLTKLVILLEGVGLEIFYYRIWKAGKFCEGGGGGNCGKGENSKKGGKLCEGGKGNYFPPFAPAGDLVRIRLDGSGERN